MWESCKIQGYVQSQSDHIMFYKHSEQGKVVVLIVCMDDIVLTGDDAFEFKRLKKALSYGFEIKDEGPLRYFLGIEFSLSKKGILSIKESI